MTLCLVASWEGCSATALIVPTGGQPMRLSLPSVSGQGGLQMKRQGNGYELYPLLT